MRGVLLVNMGTPESPEKDDVKRFIAEIISDPLVTTNMPKWLTIFLANKVIAPLSAKKSSKKYKKIWRREEPSISPLLYNMQNLAKKLESTKGVPVEIAMRYGRRSMRQAFKRLEERCPLLHEVVLFPLYPHYARSTVQSVYDELGRIFFGRAYSFRIKIVRPYFNHTAYIDALADSLKMQLHGIDRLLFCYHSLPVKHIEEGRKLGKEFDYLFQIKETTKLLCERVNYNLNNSIMLYSSQRLGNWLKPYLDKTISYLPEEGWKKIAIIAPGFIVDNLETLYDIDIYARKLFMDAGGKEMRFIRSLNDNEVWVDAIWKIINSQL